MSVGTGLAGYAAAFLNESVVDEGVFRTYHALVPEHVQRGGNAAAFDFMRTAAAEARERGRGVRWWCAHALERAQGVHPT